MSEANFESWQEWPKDGLESVSNCPVCGSNNRKILYQNLRDRLFGAPGKWTMFLCTNCKSGYLDPRPTQEKVGLAYAKYVTHETRKSYGAINFIGRIKFAIRNGYLNKRYGYKLEGGTNLGYWAMYALPSPIRWEWDHYARNLEIPYQGNMKLLDIGCGNGEFIENACQAGWLAEGIEPDPQAAIAASARNIKVKVGKYEAAEYPSNHFDVICSNQVIEHVHNPIEFVNNIFEWLKPGGRIWIGTPNLDSAIHHRFCENYGNLHPPQHFTVFTPESLQKLVQSAGFTNIKFIKRGFHDYSQCLGSSALKRGLLNESVYRGVKDAPIMDRLLGLYYELRAWVTIKSCSDLILVARKPE